MKEETTNEVMTSRGRMVWVKEAEPDEGIEIVEMFLAVESEAKVTKSAIALYRRRCPLLYILRSDGGREKRERETKVGKRGSFE